tara:strand:- start:372 stop:692 length:321 start_codon:yes stop_codon:yes gene_type:complete
MKIDFKTGKVIYTDYLNEDPEEVKQSIEDMKITDTLEDDPNEPLFSYTIHKGLKYGRLKYMFYCFLLILDGIVGIISLGKTQSIMASKFLLSKWIMEGCDDRQNIS